MSRSSGLKISPYTKVRRLTMDWTPGKDRMRWCGAAWASILRVAIVVCVLDSTHSVDEHTSFTNAHLRLGSDVIATARQLSADSSHFAGAKPYPVSCLCEIVRLRGGDASWGQDAAEDGYRSSEIGESVAMQADVQLPYARTPQEQVQGLPGVKYLPPQKRIRSDARNVAAAPNIST